MTSVRGTEPWRRRLFLPAYKVVDAARYVGTSPQNVSNWHYRDLGYGAVLPGRERGKPLSYLELIEVAVVAVFRSLGVSLETIGKTRDYAAQHLGSEYPFVAYEFKTEGHRMLMEFSQFEPDFDPRRVIVADAGGQLGWEHMMAERFAQFDYEYDQAMVWHVAGRNSLVRIDPRIAFGAPMVRGIPTWVLKGRWKAGESRSDIQEDFGLGEAEISQALKFEQVEAAA